MIYIYLLLSFWRNRASKVTATYSFKDYRAERLGKNLNVQVSVVIKTIVKHVKILVV